MQTYNFDLRYIEIALSMMNQIEEKEHVNIFELMEYLQCVDEYSLEFPKVFRFKLPDGNEDTEYNNLKNWLQENGLYEINGEVLLLTKVGIDFFRKLEEKCLQIEQAFKHYSIVRC